MGRMQAFEFEEALTAEKQLQLMRFPFQELMVGECTSAGGRKFHAHLKTCSVMNFLLSNSSKTLDRVRLP